MEFTLAVEPTHLVVRITGAPSEHELRAMLDEMVPARGKPLRALVEVKVAFGLDVVTTKKLVTALPALGFPPSYRIAVLLLDDAARRAAEFAEDVAVNRGLAVRVFRDRERALQWLLA